MIKRTFATLALLCLLVTAHAQAPEQTEPVDTAFAASIIDNYLRMVDFTPLLKDSMLCAVTYVYDRSHPTDTMTIYHWYMSKRRLRIEMWQGGKLFEGYYTDGVGVFRSFRSATRTWEDMAQNIFYNYVFPLDIRGALYDWRTKGAEVSYAGLYNYEGHDVHRVYVTSPGIFDRYYLFEKESGLLFMVTENDRLYGDAGRVLNAKRVDWRAWHEFVPLHNFLLPSIESYQYDSIQIVLEFHHYHMEAPLPTLFTEDYHRM